MKGYTTIAKDTVQSQTVINKSRFICHVKGVSTTEEAVDFIAEISKKHYDATHNCYAFVLPDYAKFSDDGEPQGTAGIPILECIKKQRLFGVAAVVTRYFGGIKLGAGGLTRAYSSSTAATLALCKKIELAPSVKLTFELSYDGYKGLLQKLSDKYKTQIDYDEIISVAVTVKQVNAEEAEEFIRSYTSGKIIPRQSQPFLEEI